jgi:hypothetical protein
MRAMLVATSHIRGQRLLEMMATEDEEPIGAFSADGAHASLGERVRSWRSNWCLDDSDPLGAEHLVEAGSELPGSVPDKELERPGALGARLLRRTRCPKLLRRDPRELIWRSSDRD